MDWTIEVIYVPVSDVERARKFYVESLGFRQDHDFTANGEERQVQLTPPGSGCSIQIGTALTTLEPGSQTGTHLVVPDLRAAHAELTDRGVEVGDLRFVADDGERAATASDDLDNRGFCSFTDPDGNSWVLQQIGPAARPTGRDAG